MSEIRLYRTSEMNDPDLMDLIIESFSLKIYVGLSKFFGLINRPSLRSVLVTASLDYNKN